MPMSSSRRERGASAILIAASLLMLMGFAAVAVDGGLGMSERRQAQAAADFSALAAVQFSDLSTTPAACNHPTITGDAVELAKCRGAVEAMRVTGENLPTYSIDWASCIDPEPARAALYPERPTVVIGGAPVRLQCIRFNGPASITQQARVALPPITFSTTFARAIGFNNLTVRASAEAKGDLSVLYNVIPFAIPADHSSSYECLKSGPHPDWGRCKDMGSNGNFGYADIPAYGNSTIGSSYDNCNPTNVTLISNIVRGVDHSLGTYPVDPAVSPPSATNKARRDDSGNDTAVRQHVCPVFNTYANEIDVQKGVVAGGFETGMIFGYYPSSPYGRLYDASGFTVRNGSPATRLDNTPLWRYLTGAPSSGAVPCPTPGTPLSIDSTQEMIDCLDRWAPGDGIIFDNPSLPIKDAKRFSSAPRFWSPFISSNWYLVQSLEPVFLDTTYYRCNSGSGCSIIHVPGVSSTGACVAPATTTGFEPPDSTCGTPGPSNHFLDAVTAYILKPGMVPPDALVRTSGPLQDLALTR